MKYEMVADPISGIARQFWSSGLQVYFVFQQMVVFATAPLLQQPLLAASYLQEEEWCLQKLETSYHCQSWHCCSLIEDLVTKVGQHVLLPELHAWWRQTQVVDFLVI